ncbi:PREDICTED: uncharacterized protein LOC106809274 [Priapulus caudatus]|uniref:Uncharacterized protein LOC106809274 n=1 Tax=Priapulus caudatus TaxID=37621 RepID=A0ABM1E6F1_PRICU|nr:PREDICTED: uncharacterized protein LOC106809274 [Priapulus caudatus]
MAAQSTGYGPRARVPLFDGDEDKYELWEVKFLGYMRLQKLHEIIQRENEIQDGDSDAATARTKNADAFAEMVQCLDDRSLSLIMRDARDDGRKAFKILREHYRSQSKPRIITLYTELTSLKKLDTETVTDYMLRAESSSTSLKMSGEMISDSLLVAMVLKGLPQQQFKPFTTVVTQKDKALTFTEFKVALRNFEDTEKLNRDEGAKVEDSVMKAAWKARVYPSGGTNVKCYSCGKMGHKVADCRSKKQRWCDVCKNHTHDTKFCRKQKKDNANGAGSDSAKRAELAKSLGDNHTFDFVFKVGEMISPNVNGMLVDCGATAHIVTDKSKFVKFNKNFVPARHYMELANGDRSNNVALARGDAKITIVDNKGRQVDALLNNTLYIPTYPQDIFSVQAATEMGATITFLPDSAQLVHRDGTKFDILKSGKLYYLNRASEMRRDVTSDTVNVTRSLKD